MGLEIEGTHLKMLSTSRCHQLAPALEKNSKLTYLDVSHNGISSVGSQIIGTSLHVNTGLRKLLLQGNPVGCKGGRALIRAAEASNIQLDLGGCDMTLEV